MKTTIELTPENISSAIAEIEAELKKKNVKSKKLYKTVLSVEEIICSLAEMPGVERVTYEISDLPWKKQVILTAKGPKYESAISDGNLNLDLTDVGEDTGEYIRRVVLNSLSDNIQYSYRKGVNHIAVDFAHHGKINPIFTAIFAAVVVGFICRLAVPDVISKALCDYALTPISKIMLALLQMLVGPMVFFSIATSISQYTNFSEFGRVGIKVLMMYMVTSIMAIFVGFLMFGIFSPGISNSFPLSGTTTGEVSMSLMDSLIGIFPSNAVISFSNNDMLQIIVIAVLVGIAAGRMKMYRESAVTFLNASNEAIGEIMKIISKGIPLLAFSSLCRVIISIGVESLVSVLQASITTYGGFVVMIGVYMLILFFGAKVNPFIFIKKHLPYMLNSAAIMSSNASIPKTMEDCENCGVPKKVYSFSIPLGATVNMDGMTIESIIMALVCAKMCGVVVSDPITLVNLSFTVLMLSLATPGVPGAGSANQVVLLSVLGLPVEMLPLLLTVESLCDMGNTASNVTGDVVATIFVSAREKILDMKKYKS